MRSMTITMLDRTKFRRDWSSALLFLLLAGLPTVWVLLGPDTRMEAILGTIVASSVIGLIGAWFLYREGIRPGDIGLGARHWAIGAGLFVPWWLVVTAVDLAARWIAPQLGVSIQPIEVMQWSSVTILDVVRAWIFVGFAEEIAFRGYLHNKLIKTTGQHWLGMGLAALIFGLWHIPGDTAQAGTITPGMLATALFFALFAFLMLHLTYEWTAMLPLVALFHGWNDYLLIATLEAPTMVGVAAGYPLFFAMALVYGRLGVVRPVSRST